MSKFNYLPQEVVADAKNRLNDLTNQALELEEDLKTKTFKVEGEGVSLTFNGLGTLLSITGVKEPLATTLLKAFNHGHDRADTLRKEAASRIL